MKTRITTACLITACLCLARAETDLRIVSFGDSTTAPRNVGASRNGRPTDRPSSRGLNDAGNTVTTVDHTDPYLYIYSDVLRDELPGLLARGVISICNEGIGANRTDQALARLKSDVRSKNADLVVIQFGVNDSAHDAGPGTPSRVPLDLGEQYGPDGLPGGGDDHPNAARGNYESNLTQIVTTLRSDRTDVILMTPNRITDYRVVTESRLGLYAQAMRDVASVQGLSLVDVWKGYTEVMAGGKTKAGFLLDGVHPNGDGQFLAASILIPTIQEATGLHPARIVAPTNLHQGLSLDQRLAWAAGPGTISHEVYLGTDPAPSFVTNQVGTTYDPGELQPETTYYWRINEITPAHTVTGQVWRFTTGSGSVPITEIEKPTDLPSCRLWLEADDIDADGSAHANGETVDEWHDSRRQRLCEPHKRASGGHFGRPIGHGFFGALLPGREQQQRIRVEGRCGGGHPLWSVTQRRRARRST
jgi:lysophospholipase L1-like esterase